MNSKKQPQGASSNPEEEFFHKTKEEQMIEFQREIESNKTEDVTYLELIAEYCDQNGIEVEGVKELISPNLKAKILRESSNLRLLKNRTPSLS